jgi:hypothetical protein
MRATNEELVIRHAEVIEKYPSPEIWIDALFKEERITRKDVWGTPDDYRALLWETINRKIAETRGNNIEHDAFQYQIEDLLGNTLDDFKNKRWQSNHINITNSISKLMKDYGRMPSVVEISNEAQLSRQTVNRHMKEYSTDHLFAEELNKFKFMSTKVLAKVFSFAVNGDVKAAKLYFEMVGGIGIKADNTTFVQNQLNNFIVVNGMVIKQGAIKKLNPQQLIQIEDIAKTAQEIELNTSIKANTQ